VLVVLNDSGPGISDDFCNQSSADLPAGGFEQTSCLQTSLGTCKRSDGPTCRRRDQAAISGGDARRVWQLVRCEHVIEAGVDLSSHSRTMRHVLPVARGRCDPHYGGAPASVSFAACSGDRDDSRFAEGASATADGEREPADGSHAGV
jgi:hypothetical protein